ncbi:hypothetical protein C1H46_036717 [Malus baccata]|uniref:FBD domain-containing protein n=1 Tax=Malus baccata TaxID=106549 RepID=A0A540KUR5_MALBA|nr:hypothetical protein C1H46_036717 [Malus baccata]
MDFLSNLEYLRLKDVSIKDDDDRFFKWLSGSCTSIKELLLENCLGVNNLIIESSSLESFWCESHDFNDECHLNISGDRLEKLHFDAPIGLVNISAPNLKYLEWFGEFKTRQNLGNLMFLEKAMIYSTTQISNFDVLFDFLCSIRKVKVLILDPIILEGLLEIERELSFISQAKEFKSYNMMNTSLMLLSSHIINSSMLTIWGR